MILIGSCKHDVKAHRVGTIIVPTLRESPYFPVSQISQIFRPWTVGTIDCPNLLNRLVRNLGTILIHDVNPSVVHRAKSDDCPNIRTYYNFLLGTIIVPSRIVVVCSGLQEYYSLGFPGKL